MSATKRLFGLALLFFLSACAGSPASSAPSGASLIERSDTIKTAYLQAEATNSTTVRKTIYANLERFSAAVTSESWQDESNERVSGSITVRVPSSHFLEMLEWYRASFEITNMDLYAREQNPGDSRFGDVRDGVAYSTIYLRFEPKIGFVQSFMLGLRDGSGALQTSLRMFIPVLTFLAPWVIFFYVAFKVGRVLDTLLDRRVARFFRRKPAAVAAPASAPAAAATPPPAEPPATA
ncbi:MAG: DUF4349 domain-containing protein [Thermoflexales bacterium]|nr:DUF4349 domain-containing protein [Thermoflexales bacterium]